MILHQQLIFLKSIFCLIFHVQSKEFVSSFSTISSTFSYLLVQFCYKTCRFNSTLLGLSITFILHAEANKSLSIKIQRRTSVKVISLHSNGTLNSEINLWRQQSVTVLLGSFTFHLVSHLFTIFQMLFHLFGEYYHNCR